MKSLSFIFPPESFSPTNLLPTYLSNRRLYSIINSLSSRLTSSETIVLYHGVAATRHCMICSCLVVLGISNGIAHLLPKPKNTFKFCAAGEDPSVSLCEP
jgi:hypothetical protein